MELYEIMHLLFFPGIVIHECAHAFACLLLGVPIKKIKFIGKSGGFVIHEDSRTDKIIIISLFPFVFNIFISLLCARIYLLSFDPFIKLVVAWIGISAILFSIPSSKDTENSFLALKKTYTQKQSIGLLFLKILLGPVVFLILMLLLFFKIFDKFMIIRLLLVTLWIFLFIV